MAFFVDDLALGVHHVVVFEQSFTDTEVVFFDLALGPFDGLGNHRVFNHLALFKSETVHYLGDAFRAEQSHEVVFERYVEYRRTRVALSSGTTTQLTVDAA